VRSPKHFFSSLDRLGLAYPEVRWEPPGDQQAPYGWLSKRSGSEGGSEVRRAPSPSASHSLTAPDRYYQHRVPGTSCSALFIANGADARLIGVNILSVDSSDATRPFRFAGARTGNPLDHALFNTLQTYVLALTQAFALRGINSLDCVLRGGQVWLLELNPRISATLSLYDADYPEGLVARHIAGCRGYALGETHRTTAARAFRILYARRPGAIPAQPAWPAWSADRPRGGTKLRAGQPICSIAAESQEHAALDGLLSSREWALRRALML
jgi:predicted ATP-grasp superfamily ATP-dependent carboligase